MRGGGGEINNVPNKNVPNKNVPFYGRGGGVDLKRDKFYSLSFWRSSLRDLSLNLTYL